MVARPCIVARVRDHAGANWIEFDIAHQRQQILFAIDNRCAVTPLPQRAAAPVREIEVLNIASSYGLEDLADAVIEFRGCQKMNMVGHPDIGMDRQAMLFRGFDQGIAKKLIVGLRRKNGLSVIAALDDMLRLAGDDIAG